MDYLPSTDAGFRDWLANYSTILSVDYLAYGLMLSDAQAIEGARNAYDTAYVTANTMITRNPGTVAAKNAARAAAAATVRPYSQQIQANEGVSNQQLEDLGLPIRDTDPTPIEAPVTSPILAVIGATPLSHTLTYADQNTPSAKAKPPGAIGMELWVHVGEGAVTDPDLASFHGLITRQPVGVSFDSPDATRTALTSDAG